VREYGWTFYILITNPSFVVSFSKLTAFHIPFLDGFDTQWLRGSTYRYLGIQPAAKRICVAVSTAACIIVLDLNLDSTLLW
jgi:hypothetical protein